MSALVHVRRHSTIGVRRRGRAGQFGPATGRSVIRTRANPITASAGDGNRTRDAGVAYRRVTTTLHPQRWRSGRRPPIGGTSIGGRARSWVATVVGENAGDGHVGGAPGLQR